MDALFQAHRTITQHNLDFGNGCSVMAIETKIDDVRDKLETYNTLLSKVDAAANDFGQAEKELSSLLQKVLIGVAMKYNKESCEYEMVGGVRPSKRRRSRRSATSAATKAATA